MKIIQKSVLITYTIEYNSTVTGVIIVEID